MHHAIRGSVKPPRSGRSRIELERTIFCLKSLWIGNRRSHPPRYWTQKWNRRGTKRRRQLRSQPKQWLGSVAHYRLHALPIGAQVYFLSGWWRGLSMAGGTQEVHGSCECMQAQFVGQPPGRGCRLGDREAKSDVSRSDSAVASPLPVVATCKPYFPSPFTFSSGGSQCCFFKLLESIL